MLFMQNMHFSKNGLKLLFSYFRRFISLNACALYKYEHGTCLEAVTLAIIYSSLCVTIALPVK